MPAALSSCARRAPAPLACPSDDDVPVADIDRDAVEAFGHGREVTRSPESGLTFELLKPGLTIAEDVPAGAEYGVVPRAALVDHRVNDRLELDDVAAEFVEVVGAFAHVGSCVSGRSSKRRETHSSSMPSSAFSSDS